MVALSLLKFVLYDAHTDVQPKEAGMDGLIETSKCRGSTYNAFVCYGEEGKQCYSQDTATVRYSCGKGSSRSHCPAAQPKGAKA